MKLSTYVWLYILIVVAFFATLTWIHYGEYERNLAAYIQGRYALDAQQSMIAARLILERHYTLNICTNCIAAQILEVR